MIWHPGSAFCSSVRSEKSKKVRMCNRNARIAARATMAHGVILISIYCKFQFANRAKIRFLYNYICELLSKSPLSPVGKALYHVN